MNDYKYMYAVESNKNLNSYTPKGSPLPEGNFFNEQVGTDVWPCLIVEVKSEKTIVVEYLDSIADKSKNPEQGHQDWLIYRKPENERELKVFTKRKSGRWIEKGKADVYHCTSGRVSKTPIRIYDWYF